MTEMTTGARIVEIARGWIGTPYHHQASCKGVGADCLGLVRGVYRDVMGRDADVTANYTRDWAEASGVETMLAGASSHLDQIDVRDVQAGDVIVFRLRHGCVAKHAAIVATQATMIHAMEGCTVSEVALSPWWRRHIAGAFRFPKSSNGA